MGDGSQDVNEHLSFPWRLSAKLTGKTSSMVNKTMQGVQFIKKTESEFKLQNCLVTQEGQEIIMQKGLDIWSQNYVIGILRVNLTLMLYACEREKGKERKDCSLKE